VNTWEKFRGVLYLGRHPPPEEGDTRLYLNGRYLYVAVAPEPNDIDWKIINARTWHKVSIRIKTFFYTCLVVVILFGAVWAIKYGQDLLTKKAKQLKGSDGAEERHFLFLVIKFLSVFISIFIVVFNKYYYPEIIKKINA
jgi:hypothetical protein